GGAEGGSRSASLEQRGVVEGTPACAADNRVADENVKGAETGVQKAFVNECLAPVGRTGDSIEAEAASTKEDALGKASGIVEPDNDRVATPRRGRFALREAWYDGEGKISARVRTFYHVRRA